MLLTISELVTDDTRQRLQESFSRLSWRDGRVTAGRTASDVKRNEQADLSSALGRAFQTDVMADLEKNQVLQAAARPKRFSNLILSRTSNGGFYGPHIDNAVMRKGKERFRSDLSFTLFLSEPSTYRGGELIVHTAGASHAVKGEAGDLVLYPSSFIHEVSPVEEGERIVCVGWIESLIEDATQRELLFDLENLRTSLRASLPANSAERLTLDKSIANLLRMWMKT